MTSVKQLLETKGNDIWSVAPETSVYDAIRLMAEREVGALLVLEHGSLVGIVSERDYARKVVLRGRASRDTPVSTVMTKRVIYARPDQSVDECMALMTEKRIRHLPVMDADRLLGVVSIGDLVKSIIAEQKHIIEQLEQYIIG